MPVIRHDTEGHDRDRVPFQALAQNPEEFAILSRFVEERRPLGGAVDDMTVVAGSGRTKRSWHSEPPLLARPVPLDTLWMTIASEWPACGKRARPLL